MKKKVFCWLLVLLIGLGGIALAETEFSYEGEVVAGKTIPVTAPFGGRVGEISLRPGSWIQEGEEIARLETTLNYAPVEGKITGLYAAEGDSTESVAERYGAVLYIEPTHRYMLEATNEKAYNSSENYYIRLGERVYLTCATDGTHQGTGMVTALTESGYNIEVTGGEFYLNEKVDIFREESRSKESRLGRGTVKRAKPVEVKGSGSVLKLRVAQGDFVERGEVLFETVEGVLDGLYAPDSKIVSPATGVVDSVEKNTGDTVGKDETILKVMPAKTFQVQFDVPESEIFTLQEGQPVSMELYWDNMAGRTYDGVITEISHKKEEQKAEGDRKVFRAYVSFEADERIRLGMTMIIYPGAEPEAKTEEPAEPVSVTANEPTEEEAKE